MTRTEARTQIHQRMLSLDVVDYELIRREKYYWEVAIDLRDIFKFEAFDRYIQLQEYELERAIQSLRKIAKVVNQVNRKARRSSNKGRRAIEKLKIKALTKSLREYLMPCLEASLVPIAAKAIARQKIARISPRTELEKSAIEIASKHDRFEKIVKEACEKLEGPIYHSL